MSKTSTKERKKQISSSADRKKRRYLASQKITQRNNEQKLKELKKQRKNVKYDSRGRKIDTKPNLISNIGKNADFGQRAAKLKAGGHGMGADYKKSEKKAFKEAEKFKKKQAKEKLKIMKDKERKERKRKSTSTGGGTRPSGTGVRSKFIKYKGKMLRRGTPQAKKAEAAETARKKLGAKGYMR